jgi:hypothetical protein
MKKVIYILLFATATFASMSAISHNKVLDSQQVATPIGGLALDPK